MQSTKSALLQGGCWLWSLQEKQADREINKTPVFVRERESERISEKREDVDGKKRRSDCIKEEKKEKRKQAKWLKMVTD